MENIQKSKKENKIVLLLLLIFISLGYAVLNANLKINGTSKINNSRWNIYFNNVVINQNSVTLSTGDSAAAIKTNDATEVNYTVTLNKPGDFYEFTVDAVNDGTVDAMIDTILSTYKIGEGETTTITSNNLPSYLTYSTTYSDNKPILQNQYLKAGATETYKVRIEYKKDISNNELLETDQSIVFSFIVNYKQADSNAIVRNRPVSFSTDDWETIISAAQDGNTSAYTVGSTKTVDMGELGTHILRVANNSTPEECTIEEGFSQTACGFVLEFADIITTNVMNSAFTNVGGWAASEMRTYVNSEIYNALPTALKNAIIDTTVVSGHGSNNCEVNTISTDKIYLLSNVEVWGNNSFSSEDSARELSRQMDYYTNLGINENNYSGAIKKYNGTNSFWWLRTAKSNANIYYNGVSYQGSKTSTATDNTNGVSPAFRLGVQKEKSPTFEDDDWSTIISNVQNNTIPTYYKIGATKKVNMGILGIYTLRIANNTKTPECEIEGFSQTACGFVLEFADIISNHQMNSGFTNVGGWLSTTMRTYLNTDIYNSLPSELKNAIIDTNVVSGHGSKNGEVNFVSKDKLYLLSNKEIWGNKSYSDNDSAKDLSRQMDYYKDLIVDDNNYCWAIKKYSGTNSFWWLRTAMSNATYYFNGVSFEGKGTSTGADYTKGVSPAFRLG